MTKKFLDYDDFSGVATFHSYDEGKTALHYVQDVQPALEANHAMATSGHNGFADKEKVFQHVAFIPNIVIAKWRAEDGIDVFKKDHLPAVLRKLNDIDNRKLRTGAGRLADRGKV